jgi:hypothetical protein
MEHPYQRSHGGKARRQSSDVDDELAEDFFRYFSEIGLTLRIDPVEDAPGDAGQYIRRFAEWMAVAKYPKLVSNFYLLKSDATARPQALRLNSSARRFEQTGPPSLSPCAGT